MFEMYDHVLAGDVRGQINGSWLNANGEMEYEIISRQEQVAFTALESEIKALPLEAPAQIELPLVPEGAIAVAYEGEQAYDYPQNWETCQQFAQNGYRVVVVADEVMESEDGKRKITRSKGSIQSMCDYEREMLIDCFGVDSLR